MAVRGSNGNGAGFGGKADLISGSEVVNKFSLGNFDEINRFSFAGFFQEKLRLGWGRGRTRRQGRRGQYRPLRFYDQQKKQHLGF